MRLIFNFILIFFIWVLLSFEFTITYIITGIILAFIIILMSYKINLYLLSSSSSLSYFSSVSYFFWLIYEIFINSNNLVRIIWKYKLDISPTFGYIKTFLPDDSSKVIYASSVTLTPGTLTMKLDANNLAVHSLTLDGFEDIKNGFMEQKIYAMIKKK